MLQNYLLIVLIIGCWVSCQPKATPSVHSANTFYQGADLSFLPEMEQAGTVFFEGNQKSSALQILKKAGLNLVRLRLWHTPAPEHRGHSSLTEVLAFAKKIKTEKLDFLLDFHYSDTWADPGKQSLPEAWKNLTINDLGDSVFAYTQKVVQAFKNQNTLPQMIQIGNETNSGMLWNLGKVGGEFESNWPNYAFLIKKAIAGIKSIDTENKIKVMLHFAGYQGADWFFQNIQNQGVNYDIMGLSYYPNWHGKSLTELKTNLNDLIRKFDHPILIVETAYPWTLDYNDFTNNFVGLAEQLMPGYPASPQGQKQFLSDLKKTISTVDKNYGIGFCYWEPAWVAFKGKEATNGSVWENQTLFDFQNKALPALEVFKE
jgi:arabinogalactan endo-1,4-beta-galactosidase